MLIPTWPSRSKGFEPSSLFTPSKGRHGGLLSAFAEEYRRAMAVTQRNERMRVDLAKAVAMSRKTYLDDLR